MVGRLEGRVAVVVGAGTIGEGVGNGRATAVLFAREGARVFAIDRDPASLELTRQAIRDEGGVIECYTADVTVPDQVRDAMQRCASIFGGINVLHNNVGITKAGGAVQTSKEDWDRVLLTNLTSAFLTCREALPIMEASGKGSIINVSSLLAMRTRRTISYLSYSVSKAGLNQLTREIASQYAPKNIRANNLVLGSIDTPQIRESYNGEGGVRQIFGDEEADRLLRERDKKAPMGRQGTPWEVAQAALFLASDESSYTTGSDIYIDGGLALNSPG